MRQTARWSDPADAFTLLEVCLAIFIAMLIVMVAVPSIQGLMNEQREKRFFEKFDALAQEAQSRSVTERRAYLLAWDDKGITVRPMEPRNRDEREKGPRMDFAEKQNIGIELPAALVKKTDPLWTFWPTGTCEPAMISGHDEAGQWSATYDPLTARASFSTQ